MARARLGLCFTLLALLMSIKLSALTDSPTEPPTNSPEADAPESPTQPPLSPSPDISSPPAPPPESSSSPGPSPSLPPTDDDDDDDNEGSSPSPLPDDDPEEDVPAPEANEWTNVKSGVTAVKKKDEGMSGGTKAGIVIGVFAFAGLAALGGFVYKKRKENMERAAFGAAVRREFL